MDTIRRQSSPPKAPALLLLVCASVTAVIAFRAFTPGERVTLAEIAGVRSTPFATVTETPVPTANHMAETESAGRAYAAELDAKSRELALTLTVSVATDDAQATREVAQAQRTETAVVASTNSEIVRIQIVATDAVFQERARIEIEDMRNRSSFERGRQLATVLGIVFLFGMGGMAILYFGYRFTAVFETVATQPAASTTDEQSFDVTEIPQYTDVGDGEYIDAVRHGGFDKVPNEWVVKFALRVARDRTFAASHYADVPAGDNGRVMYESFRQVFVDNYLAINQAGRWIPTERGVRMARNLSNPPTVADVTEQENQA